MAKIGKRIIVGCDGTWMNSDNGYSKPGILYKLFGIGSPGGAVTPSNVTRLCRALQPSTRPSDAVGSTQSQPKPPQTVFYEPGIGSSNNFFDHIVNGTTGDSISEYIRAGYQRIAANWVLGDEIFLIGFSRGSFTVRSIAAMICEVGLLTKEGMEHFYEIFDDWEHQLNLNGKYQQKLFGSLSQKGRDPDYEPGIDFKNKAYGRRPDGTPTTLKYFTYALKLQRKGWTTLEVPIQAISCFDTVGSLGLPRFGLLAPLTPPNRAYAFVDTEVLPNVDHCFHALALDEIRKPFTPTLWELPHPRAGQVLKQCWFPGEHGNVGGSTDDAELPNIALAWMTEQLKDMLDFDISYLRYCSDANKRYYASAGGVEIPKRRGWALGYLIWPVSFPQQIAGTEARTPGMYFRYNKQTGIPEPKNIMDARVTHETVHPAARVRLVTPGTNYEDKGKYKATALISHRYKLELEDSPKNPVPGDVGKDPTSGPWIWNTNGTSSLGLWGAIMTVLGRRRKLPKPPMPLREEKLKGIELMFLAESNQGLTLNPLDLGILGQPNWADPQSVHGTHVV